jgi:archaellum component FlaC
MRKSERLRQLELTVVRMEMTLELLSLAINNVMASQEMEIDHAAEIDALESRLDAGKWYKNTKETP